MRNLMAAFAALGLASATTIAPTVAYSRTVPTFEQSDHRQLRHDVCAPRCQEQHRVAMRERLAQQRHREEQRRVDRYRHAPVSYHHDQPHHGV